MLANAVAGSTELIILFYVGLNNYLYNVNLRKTLTGMV